jgi:DNA-binding MarR family transcriptional regulator
VLHSASEPIKPSSIALLLFQETQSVTGILHRIEAQGWVKRLPDPNDRRAVGLTLTPPGKKIGDEIAVVSKELYNELFSDALSATERRQVEAGLRKIRAKGFQLPETDFKLRRAQQFPVWKD